ncbi:MAG: hypothetical protein O7D30_12050, partial [Rickettsia endosymbiont of Ixodes persulcatus]|nr:hypothetical protein [Rickettsia endosymbiont of Ixodes persulcatus]
MIVERTHCLDTCTFVLVELVLVSLGLTVVSVLILAANRYASTLVFVEFEFGTLPFARLSVGLFTTNIDTLARMFVKVCLVSLFGAFFLSPFVTRLDRISSQSGFAFDAHTTHLLIAGTFVLIELVLIPLCLAGVSVTFLAPDIYTFAVLVVEVGLLSLFGALVDIPLVACIFVALAGVFVEGVAISFGFAIVSILLWTAYVNAFTMFVVEISLVTLLSAFVDRPFVAIALHTGAAFLLEVVPISLLRTGMSILILAFLLVFVAFAMLFVEVPVVTFLFALLAVPVVASLLVFVALAILIVE